MNNFNRVFIEKIRCLKDRFNSHFDHKTHGRSAVNASLDTFAPVNLKYIIELIQSAPNKTCDLNPIPASIMKSIAATIAPASTDNKLIHKNYRPVSIKPFVSKLLEQSVIDQLKKHAEINDLDDDLQSAYRPNSSTEAALLHVVNSLLVAMDNRMAILIGILDLSAALDRLTMILCSSASPSRTV